MSDKRVHDADFFRLGWLDFFLTNAVYTVALLLCIFAEKLTKKQANTLLNDLYLNTAPSTTQDNFVKGPLIHGVRAGVLALAPFVADELSIIPAVLQGSPAQSNSRILKLLWYMVCFAFNAARERKLPESSPLIPRNTDGEVRWEKIGRETKAAAIRFLCNDIPKMWMSVSVMVGMGSLAFAQPALAWFLSLYLLEGSNGSAAAAEVQGTLSREDFMAHLLSKMVYESGDPVAEAQATLQYWATIGIPIAQVGMMFALWVIKQKHLLISDTFSRSREDRGRPSICQWFSERVLVVPDSKMSSPSQALYAIQENDPPPSPSYSSNR